MYMKKIIQIVVLIALASQMAGCASSGYWVNRKRDAADIFTFTAGNGLGAKIRFGPYYAGWLENNEKIGLLICHH